ncbi:MAG: GAF domain-containing protein [Chloroflexota bacterium]
MTAPRAGSNGAGALFPVVLALEAFEAWSARPGATSQRLVADALGAIVEAVGASGGYVAVDAPPLPALEVGWGSLAYGVPTADSTATRLELHGEGRTATLGTLWIDGGDALVAARAIAAGLESAWARAALRQSAGRLAALDDATRGIAEVLDVGAVLQLIVDRVRELVGAGYAAIGIVDDAGSIERFITSGITPAQRVALGPPPRGHGLLGLIIREGRTYRIPDIGRHPDSSGFPPNHPPMRSLLGVPVRLKGRIVGNLYLTDKRDANEFSEGDEEIVEMFALHAGIAMENARLHERVQQLAVVEERERIAKDLHDGIIQGIYAVGLSLEDVPDLMDDDPPEARARVDRAIDSLHLTIRDIRNFILGLQSEFLQGSDLVVGLRTLAEEFRLNSAIDVRVDVDSGAAAADLVAPADRVSLLQMAREALSNAARHSGATNASVSLAAGADALTMTIADDGGGFDPAAVTPSGHLGLRNLRERAAAMGAELTLDAARGRGTRIIVAVPTTSAGGPRA